MAGNTTFLTRISGALLFLIGAVLLAGGGQAMPYRHPLDGRQFRAGIARRPLFSAQLGFDQTGWTGNTRPQTTVVDF